MATTTVTVNGDYQQHAGLRTQAGASFYTQIDEGVGSADQGTTSIFGVSANRPSGIFELQNMPADFGTGISIVANVNAKTSDIKGDIVSLGDVVLFTSAGSVIARYNSVTPLTITFTTYNIPLTIVGTNNKTAWDAARLQVGFDSGTTGSGIISAVDLTITYATAAVGGGAVTTRAHKLLLGNHR